MNFIYNYNYIIFGSHSSLRKIIITQKIKNLVIHQTLINIKLKEIIIKLYLNQDEETFIFKFHNIYNIKTYIRNETLSILILIQTLIRQLYQHKN